MIETLADVLQEFMARADRNAAQLSRRTADIFGREHQVHKKAISNWANGSVLRPHRWQDVIRVAIALELSEFNTDRLLIAAGHHKISDLRRQFKEAVDQELLAHWQGPFALPPDILTFVGRESDLRRIDSIFRRETGNKRCCLIGMGGVGKTALAIRAAYQFRDRFPDGVLWAKVDETETKVILSEFAEAYGIDATTHYPDLSSRSTKVRELLANKQALIILDNAESDEQVKPLLPPDGPCSVIITTRHHDLTVVDISERFPLTPFTSTTEASLTLFARILEDPDWVRRDRDIFREIAEFLGNLPLAISIAAYRLKSDEPGWSATDFLRALRESSDKLITLKRGEDNVEALFDLSYNKLAELQQGFFTALSLFASDFSIESAACITEIPISAAKDLLRHLYNLSLIQPSKNGRYQLHSLLRVYGRYKLDENAFREQFVNCFTDYIVAHQDIYKLLDPELENILYAFELATEKQIHPQLVHGVAAFYPYLKSRGLYEQAQKYLKPAQQAAELLDDRINQAKLLGYQAEILRRRGYSSDAFTHFQEALKLIGEQPNEEELTISSWLLTGLGGLAFRNGRLQEAKTYYEKALSQAESIDDKTYLITPIANLGLVAATMGEIKEAESLYKQALKHAKQLNIKTKQITVLQNLGVLFNEQGQQKEAKKCFEQGLLLAEELESPEFQSRLLGNLGVVANAQGNYREAKQRIQRALTLAEIIGYQQLMSRHTVKLALVEANMRNDREANAYYKEALVLAEKGGWPEDISDILVSWGQFYLKQLARSEAEKCFERAEAIAKEYGFKKSLGKSLYGLAQIAEQKGDIAKARQLGEESKDILDAIGHKRANDVKYWLLGLPNKTN